MSYSTKDGATLTGHIGFISFANQGGYHEFSGENRATGHMFSATMESNQFSGVSTISMQDAQYTLLARYSVKQIGSHSWSVWTSAYYIGPAIDNMFINESTSVSGLQKSSQEINSDGEGAVFLPTGWTYIGRAGYNFTDKAGNLNVDVRFAIGTYIFGGNQPGTGYLNFIIPIRK